MTDEIQQKIAKISQSKDYNSVHIEWLPPIHSDEYYFVSYSHKDYKKVFKDIYELQNAEYAPIHFWYDTALRVGKNWEIEAFTHICDHKCKGVIFYISENSVLSDSIHKEIEFVKKSGKPYLSINLPIETIPNHIGEYHSAEEILKLLNRKIPPNDQKLKILHDTFGKNVTFLKLTDESDASHKHNIEFKAKHICEDLIPLPLLKIQNNFVIGINDHNAINIDENEFTTGTEHQRIYITNAAFANCAYLENVAIPASVVDIGEYAFYNCKNLNNISLLSEYISIGDSAFRGCSNLTNISIGGFVKSLGNNVFSYCKLQDVTITAGSLYAIPKDNLKRLAITIDTITNTTTIHEYACMNSITLEYLSISPGITGIEKYAFLVCISLKKVELPNGLDTIDDGAFMGCARLKNLTIPKSVTKIGKNAFHGCKNISKISLCGIEIVEEKVFAHCRKLKEINLSGNVIEIQNEAFSICTGLTHIDMPCSVNKIGAFAFRGCSSLSDIYYDGTMRQWNKIKKGDFWDIGTPTFIVHCLDGCIKVH